MRTWRYRQYVGTRPYSLDLTAYGNDDSSSVSSVTASSVGDVACTIANSALASEVWSADVTCSNPGRAMVKLEMTLASGDTRIAVLEIEVKGATVSQVAGGYTTFDIATG